MLWDASGSRIKEVNNTTLDGIRVHVFDGLGSGQSKAQVAGQLDSMLGLTIGQTRQVEATRQRLLREGLPNARANRRASSFARELQRQRAATIAETEMTFALEAGKLNYWETAVNNGVINPRTHRRVWIVENDERVDPICAAMAGATSPINQPFDTPVGPAHFPPLHPRCRCAVMLEPTRRNARGRNVIDANPDGESLFADFPMMTACELGSAFSSGRAQTRLLDMRQHDGGFSVHVPSGTSPPNGWMAAIPGQEVNLPLDQLTPKFINEYKVRHVTQLSQRGNHLGGWVETQANGSKLAYLDVSRRFDSLDDAIVFGKSSNQISIFNIGTKETFNLGTMSIQKAETALTYIVLSKRFGGRRIFSEFRTVDQEIQKVITSPQLNCENRYWDTVAKMESSGRMVSGLRQLDTDSVAFNRSWQRFIDDSDLVINVEPEVLEKILQSGRFKTQFETGNSGGWFMPTLRKTAESDLFGLADDLVDIDRPIYGSFTNASKAGFGGGDAYGDARVVLKGTARDRSTVTFGDSLSLKNQVPSAARDIDAAHGMPWETWNQINVEHIGDAAFKLNEFAKPGFEPWKSPLGWESVEAPFGYVEAQVHGGVVVDDIAEIIFRRTPDRTIQDLLFDKGIEWRVIGEDI